MGPSQNWEGHREHTEVLRALSPRNTAFSQEISSGLPVGPQPHARLRSGVLRTVLAVSLHGAQLTTCNYESIALTSQSIIRYAQKPVQT